MHPGQQLVGRFRMIGQKRDAMAVSVGLQAVVPEPSIGVHHAPGFDHVVDERLEIVRRRIWDTSQANPPDCAAFVFNGHDHQDLFLPPPQNLWVGDQQI
jgi:hypothetical protein